MFFEQSLGGIHKGFPLSHEGPFGPIGEQYGIHWTGTEIRDLEHFFIEHQHDESVGDGLTKLFDEVQSQGRGIAIGFVHESQEDIKLRGLQDTAAMFGKYDIGVGKNRVDRIGRGTSHSAGKVHAEVCEDADHGGKIFAGDDALDST